MFMSMGNFSYWIFFDENEMKLDHVNQNMCILFKKRKKVEKKFLSKNNV